MTDHRDKVLVGNLALQATVLAKFLHGGNFTLRYDPEAEAIRLEAYSAPGAETVLEIRQASHENFLKLADRLGYLLQEDGLRATSDQSQVTFFHNGTGTADEIELCLLELELPYRQVRGACDLAVEIRGELHKYPFTSFTTLKSVLRRFAEETGG